MKNRLIALLSLAVLPLAAIADRELERVVPADGVKEVSITNVAGSVSVVGSDRSDIRVTGTLEDDVEEVEIVKDGAILAIEVKLETGERSHREGEAELEIQMPADLRLAVTATSADITSSGVRGRQRLQSVSGDLETESWGEPLSMEAVSGDIRVKGHDEDGSARLEAVSGDVSAVGLVGTVNAKSVSGDVTIRDSRLQLGHFESTSGDIIVFASLETDVRLEAETISGDVELRLLDEPDADFDVSSFSGSIDNCFGPEPERKSRYAPGSELRFTAGEGNGEVRVKTLSGDVEICEGR